MNPKAVGELSEAIVLSHLMRAGVPVLLPFGNNQRYDFVIDEAGRFVRLQVKTGRLINGCVTFKTSSINGVTRKRTTYHGGADDFVIYCPETDAVYRIPVSECGRSMARLRVTDARGGATSKIRWAKDYLLA